MHRKTESVPLSLKPRKNYLPSTKLSARQTSHSPDLHLYSYFTDSQSNKASRFFTNNSNSVSKSTILKTSEPATIPIWEIHERLESFKFRTQKPTSQKLSFDLFQKDFALWEKTSSDINKILSHFSADLSEITTSIHTCNKKVYMDMFEYCKYSLQKSHKKVEKYKSAILGLKNEIQKVTEENEKMKKIELRDAEKIEFEIKEIFGDSIVNVEEIREKISQLKNKDRVPAADVLKELLERLPIGQKIPDYETVSPRALDMKDYELVLNSRFKNLQYSTAQKMIEFYENKDHLISKFTQTHEQITDLKSFLDTKEALDKTNSQLNNTASLLEKARLKISECENKIDALLKEKGNLITENLLKNNEIQNYREKEKILKQKIGKYKTEENFVVVGNPFMKENKVESPKAGNSPLHYTRNEKSEYSKQATFKISDPEVASEEKSEKELRVPSARGSVYNESRSSFYSSVRSRSSASVKETEQDQLIYNNDDPLDDENIEKSEISVEFKDDKSEENEENNKSQEGIKLENLNSKENIKKSRTDKAPVGKTVKKTESKEKKPATFTEKNIKKIVTANEVESGVKAAMKKSENLKSVNRTISPPANRSIKSNSPIPQSMASQVAKQNKPDIIKPSKVIISKEQSRKTETSPDPPELEKSKTDKKVTFSQQPKHHKTTSAMFPISSNEVSATDILDTFAAMQKPETEQELALKIKTKFSVSEKKPSATNTSEKPSPIIPETKKKAIPKPKPLNIQKRPKNNPLTQNSILPYINKPKPSSDNIEKSSVEQLQKHIKDLESALSTLKDKSDKSDASINTDPLPGSVETQDFSSQFGSEPVLKSKEQLIYMSPYNPNNIYGLKADRYFTSKGVFSAQPQIPDLASSALFSQPYHLSPDLNIR